MWRKVFAVSFGVTLKFIWYFMARIKTLKVSNYIFRLMHAQKEVLIASFELFLINIITNNFENMNLKCNKIEKKVPQAIIRRASQTKL